MSEVVGLSESINQAIQEFFARLSSEHVANGIAKPVLRVEAFLQDGQDATAEQPVISHHLGSRILDLSHVRSSLTPKPPSTQTVLTDGTHDVSDRQQPLTSEQSEVISSSSPGHERRYGSKHLRPLPSVRRDEDKVQPISRKPTGGLRLAPALKSLTQNDPVEDSQRQLALDYHTFPKRRKIRPETQCMQPSSLDKLVIGIWEQLHGSINLDPHSILDSYRLSLDQPKNGSIEFANGIPSHLVAANDTFSQMSVFCRKVTQASRACRSVELIVQTRWMEHFDARVEALACATPEISINKHRKAAIMEACQHFGWTEKELRNKTAIWRGYQEVKEAGGWAALVFSGMGLYRFCKYRVGFDKEAMQRLRNLRSRFEVAADTLHPHWRHLLSIIGERSDHIYEGHQHDWVVFESGDDPIPLRATYLQWDPQFTFEHIDESIVDETAWGCEDPRWLAPTNPGAPNKHICRTCTGSQSDNPKDNDCHCFPNLFGSSKRNPVPVQVMRTHNGKNNGLVALVPFERGTSIGEFTGLLTHSLANTDVMTATSPSTNRIFQIYQKRYGNYTRFVNHSCNPNAQFQQFAWMDTVRVVLVSKGIAVGEEVTVDYTDRYWGGLDKVCLCGEPCCRYKTKRLRSGTEMNEHGAPQLLEGVH
ncbi:SET domain-containing protein [Pseudovirgaria hyperparasitica]|uniref:SET domain-containing protein n=1 Tax=Pseudovirgaria hyperparasitica TaxID=470096 RepID=A0A6A6WHE4_9PEZI|nr:SET domain-containing protein [Pseudovirgaria hyperparasitica]KAF2762222.1 SET domain-containing protein [Pseudovirgaria hyperparasitica]